jgi:hypothetical protein
VDASEFIAMTEQQPVARTSPTLLRRIGWFGIACAAASLALTASIRLAGGAVRWTAWTLPILIAANAAVFFLGGLNRWPRLARPYLVVSLALAAAVMVSETLTLLHR